jgi:hypothetical protein
MSSKTKAKKSEKTPKIADKKPRKYFDQKWVFNERGFLKSKYSGRRNYWMRYRGEFEIEDIKNFAQDMSNVAKAQHVSNTAKAQRKMKEIQVAVYYANEGDKSGKMTPVGDPVDVKDLRNQYKWDVGDIVGFTLIFN